MQKVHWNSHDLSSLRRISTGKTKTKKYNSGIKKTVVKQELTGSNKSGRQNKKH